MGFLGVFLQILSFLLLVADTVGCAAMIVVDEITADDPDLLAVVALMWVVGLFICLCVLGSGIALRQLGKLKKRVKTLEERTLALTYGAHIAPTAAPVAPVAPVAPAAPIAAPVAAPVEPAAPAAPVETAPIEQPDQSPEVAAPKKKWLPFAIGGAAVVLIVAIVLIAGGKKDNETPVMNVPPDDAPQYEQVEDVGPMEEQQMEAPVDNTIPLQFGENLDHKDFSMFFHGVEIYDEYTYDTSEYSRTSLYVEPGYKLLVFSGHFTNTGTTTISESSFNRTMLVNGEYLVEGFDVRMDFLRATSFEIDPYTDMEFVIYANIPEKLAEIYESATLTLGFNEDLSIPTTIWDMEGNSTVEVEKTYSIASGIGGGTAAPDATAPATEAAPESNALISIGETIYADDYEFTLKNVEMSYEVLPPNTSSVYSSYPAPSGKVFVHVEADIKNTMQRDIRIDDLYTASALYDGAYPYDGFTIVNDDNRFDWVGSYVAATPLETVGTHSLIECPVEVDESGNSVIVTINIDGELYDYILR